jgi:hypothetical protein
VRDEVTEGNAATDSVFSVASVLPRRGPLVTVGLESLKSLRDADGAET